MQFSTRTEPVNTPKSRMDEKLESQPSEFIVSCRQLMTFLSLTGSYPWTISEYLDKAPRFSIRSFLIMLLLIFPLTVFLGIYLVYHYLATSSRGGEKTALFLHALDNLQYSSVAFLVLPLYSWSNKQLQECVVDLNKTISSTTLKTIKAFKRTLAFQGVFLFFFMLAMYYLKVYPAIGFSDILFGVNLPGWPLMLVLQSVVSVNLFCRLASLGTFTFLALSTALQFRECSKKVKSIETDASNLHSIEEALNLHLDLSRVTAKLDAVFAPAMFLYSATDVIMLTCLLNFLINSKMEISLGLYSSDGLEHQLLWAIAGVGTVSMLLIKIGISCYIHDQAHSLVPLLYHLTQRLQTSDIKCDVSLRKSYITLCTLTVQRLRDTPIEFTGWGMFTLNKKLVVTMVGLSVSYLLIMSEMGKTDTCLCNCTSGLDCHPPHFHVPGQVPFQPSVL